MHAAILRYIDEIARAGSIRRASERLNVAASALDRQILKVEEEFGVQLFERLPRGLRLTPAGELVVRHARATLHEFTRVRSEVDEIKGVKRGLVRIVCLDSLLVHFLPEVIVELHERYPAITYAVDSGVHGHVVQRVSEGEADIGITFDLPANSELEFFADVSMPIMAMVSRRHPLAQAEAVTFRQCAAYPVLLQRDILPIRSLIDAELSTLNELRRPLIASNNMTLLKPLISKGIGVAFFSPIGFIGELQNGDIIAIPIKGGPLRRLRMGLLISSRRKLAPAAVAMQDVLRRKLAEAQASLATTVPAMMP